MAEDLSQQERDIIANLIRDGKPVPARYIPSISDQPLKTELIWPGKSSVIQNSVLPFQSIEHIDEPRKEAVKQFDLFSINDSTGRQAGGWSNKLIWGDNGLILSALANGPMRAEIEKAGGLKLVYIDPPFDVGADFSVEVEVGESNVTKSPSILEEIAYRDTWGKGKDSFLSMIYERLQLINSLMSPDGSIFLHCDWRLEGQLRLLLDEVFGVDGFLNSIAWCYTSPGNFTKWLPRRHDTILWYTKGISENGIHSFNRDEVRIPYVKLDTGKTQGIFKEAKTLNDAGKIPEDWWSDITPVARLHATELNGFPTQKPEKLLERIIKLASNEGDLVADFFCGSGTTLAVAEKLGRKWIGADLGRFAIHTTRKRLISVQRHAASKSESFRAFEILNLGGYQTNSFLGIDQSLSEDEKLLQANIKREDFIDLILTAYGAQRSEQLHPFSGSKTGTAILIGSIDSAVTQDQVQQAIDVALSVGISRVDVLGFEFEMGISPAMSDAAKEQGLTLTIRYIPHEVFDKRAMAKGQVKFHEAGYVEAKLEVKGRILQVSLSDFGVFYRQDDADETAAELRNGNTKVVVDQGQVVRVAKDKKGVITKENLTSNWQDWIDYWAVDFDFASQPETITVLVDEKEVKKRTGKFIFENEWQSFRTKSDRSLELTSSPFSYADPGNYSVAVKVIDIFGNDTTRVFKIKVK